MFHFYRAGKAEILKIVENDKVEFAGHSPRRGFVTTAANKGLQ